MALTRTIPIRNLIFTPETLMPLLEELASYFKKSKDPGILGRFDLQISEDESTTISLDAPPRSFASLLNTKIHYLYLRVDSYRPRKSVELKLSPGSESRHNTIILYGEDEDWVNLAFARISKLLSNTDKQATLLRRHAAWFVGPLALLIGWPLKNIFMQVMLWMGQAQLTKWSWGLWGKHTIFAIILGFVPATFLLGHAQSCFPSLEIQSGPRHTWRSAQLRNRLRFILSLVVIGPLANLLYDVYKFVYSA